MYEALVNIVAMPALAPWLAVTAALGVALAGLVRLRRALAAQAQALAVLREELRGLLDCSQGLGERVREQQRLLRRLQLRQAQLERDEGRAPWNAAADLIAAGHGVDVLERRCGLSRAEAELVQRLHESRAPGTVRDAA